MLIVITLQKSNEEKCNSRLDTRHLPTHDHRGRGAVEREEEAPAPASQARQHPEDGRVCHVDAEQPMVVDHPREGVVEADRDQDDADPHVVLVCMFYCESNTRCAVLQYRILLDRTSKWANESQTAPSL